MQELCYSAIDIAAIISSMHPGYREESRMLDLIWENETVFLAAPYRTNRRKFLLEVYYWMHYFYEKPVLDQEFPVIQKDLTYSNGILHDDQYTSDFTDLDLFFKSIRLRILYGGGHDYVRIKLRTLLKQYGYKRRSQLLLQHINQSMFFFHLEASLRGGIPCSIETAELDQMLIFRIV